MLSLAVYVGYMARVHVGLTVACLAPTPLIWLATVWFSRWARPAYESNRALVRRDGAGAVRGHQGDPGDQAFGARGAASWSASATATARSAISRSGSSGA